jgi:hypothetical protein
MISDFDANKLQLAADAVYREDAAMRAKKLYPGDKKLIVKALTIGQIEAAQKIWAELSPEDRKAKDIYKEVFHKVQIEERLSATTRHRVFKVKEEEVNIYKLLAARIKSDVGNGTKETNEYKDKIDYDVSIKKICESESKDQMPEGSKVTREQFDKIWNLINPSDFKRLYKAIDEFHHLIQEGIKEESAFKILAVRLAKPDYLTAAYDIPLDPTKLPKKVSASQFLLCKEIWTHLSDETKQRKDAYRFVLFALYLFEQFEEAKKLAKKELYANRPQLGNPAFFPVSFDIPSNRLRLQQAEKIWARLFPQESFFSRLFGGTPEYYSAIFNEIQRMEQLPPSDYQPALKKGVNRKSLYRPPINCSFDSWIKTAFKPKVLSLKGAMGELKKAYVAYQVGDLEAYFQACENIDALFKAKNPVPVKKPKVEQSYIILYNAAKYFSMEFRNHRAAQQLELEWRSQVVKELNLYDVWEDINQEAQLDKWLEEVEQFDTGLKKEGRPNCVETGEIRNKKTSPWGNKELKDQIPLVQTAILIDAIGFTNTALPDATVQKALAKAREIARYYFTHDILSADQILNDYSVLENMKRDIYNKLGEKPQFGY